MIADLTDEAWRKDSAKSFATVNKPPGDSRSNEQSNRGRGNGCGRGNGRGRGGTGRGAPLGNQGSAKDASNKCGWCKQSHPGGEEGCWMKHPHLRPEWWRLGERRPPRSGNGTTSTTNEVSKGTSNHPSQATNSATRGIFAMQAIRPAAMASGTNIKDS